MIMRTEALPMEQLSELLKLQLEQGAAPLRVTGNSMYPTFRDQLDTVLLEKPSTPLRRGDVILYQRENGRYVLHRIIRLQDDQLILSGDNQYEPELVKPSQVIARVEKFYRNEKEFALSHPGYCFFVWLWVSVFPIRRPLFAVRRVLGKIKKSLVRS